MGDVTNLDIVSDIQFEPCQIDFKEFNQFEMNSFNFNNEEIKSEQLKEFNEDKVDKEVKKDINQKPLLKNFLRNNP